MGVNNLPGVVVTHDAPVPSVELATHRYDTVREVVLPCAQKLTRQFDLPHRTKFKKVGKRKTKEEKKDICKQSGKSMESFLKKKRKITVSK